MRVVDRVRRAVSRFSIVNIFTAEGVYLCGFAVCVAGVKVRNIVTAVCVGQNYSAGNNARIYIFCTFA